MLIDVCTGDSDPVYWAIAKARHEWGYAWATRFSVAMLAYYHTGVAAKAADIPGPEFWMYLKQIYVNAPRGGARRHMRGTPGLAALNAMAALDPQPETWFQNFPQTYRGVQFVCEKRLQQFGPYFQLKVADLMDRCLTMPIQDWSGLETNLPGEPAKAVKMLYPLKSVTEGFKHLCNNAKHWDILAAPLFDRPVGPAEVETSLCGYKTTKVRGNWFGADIIDKRQALVGYGDKAHAMIEFMPPVISKDLFVIAL